MHILIVDDDEDNRLLLLDLLKDDHAIETAANGMEATYVFQGEKEAGRPFDAVLSDVRMPVMEGDELHRRLKPELDGCRFILMTGGCSAETKAYAAREKIPILKKPLDHAVIETILSA